MVVKRNRVSGWGRRGRLGHGLGHTTNLGRSTAVLATWGLALRGGIYGVHRAVRGRDGVACSGWNTTLTFICLNGTWTP